LTFRTIRPKPSPIGNRWSDQMPDPWSDPHFAVLVNARTRLAMKCMELPIRLPIEPLTDHIGAMRQFDQEVTGALEGNALYEFDCAIEDMREQAAEVA
jgi:hypothetical protein